MSLNLKRLHPVNVKDPRICVTPRSDYCVLEGGGQENCNEDCETDVVVYTF